MRGIAGLVAAILFSFVAAHILGVDVARLMEDGARGLHETTARLVRR